MATQQDSITSEAHQGLTQGDTQKKEFSNDGKFSFDELKKLPQGINAESGEGLGKNHPLKKHIITNYSFIDSKDCAK